MKRTICAVTGSRAEFGLLTGLLKEVRADRDLDLQIVVTCMHLSPEFGLTYREIEEEGFQIDKRVEILLSSDTPVGISKSMGLAQISLSEVFMELAPDFVVLLGDRFETLCSAATACVARIPVGHIHGGEITEGAIDDIFRHAITKMSHLHFTSTDVYRQRVIQMGEHPDRVFHVGSLGVERLSQLDLLSKRALEEEIGFSFGEEAILVTYHPVTADPGSARLQFHDLLKALDSFESLRILFTKANADAEGRVVNRMIDEYVSQHPSRTTAFASMGQVRYWSAMKHVDAVLGNSSSGILEAPSLKTPVVNIGERQKGRVRAANVIDCDPSREAIVASLKEALSKRFRAKMARVVNPYERKNTALEIKEILKKCNLKEILNKRFYDLPVPPKWA